MLVKRKLGLWKFWGEKSAFGRMPAFLCCSPTAWEITLATRLPKKVAPYLQALDSQTAFPLPRALSHTELSHYPCWLFYQSDDGSIWFESVLLASGEYLLGSGGIRRHFDNSFISSCSSWILIFSQLVGGWWVCNSCLLVTTGSKKLL